MNNIDLLLENQISIYVISLFMSIGLLYLYKYTRVSISVILLNWNSFVGLSALIYIFIHSSSISNIGLLLFVIALELLLLLLTTYLLLDLVARLFSFLKEISSNVVLIKLLLISTTIWIYLLVANPTSFGIFSGGSRIDYLLSGKMPVFLTYILILVQFCMTIVISSRAINSKLSWLDIITLLIAFIISFVSGSKGAVFLMIIYILILTWGLGIKYIIYPLV
jgi:hypothetical protein